MQTRGFARIFPFSWDFWVPDFDQKNQSPERGNSRYRNPKKIENLRLITVLVVVSLFPIVFSVFWVSIVGINEMPGWNKVRKRPTCQTSRPMMTSSSYGIICCHGGLLWNPIFVATDEDLVPPKGHGRYRKWGLQPLVLPFWPKKRSAKRHLSIVPGIFIENRQPKCQWVSWQQGWGGPVSSSKHLLADAWNDWPLPSGMPPFFPEMGSANSSCPKKIQKDKIVWNCIFQQTVLLSQERNS